jgi:hypothetical protein
VEDQERVAITSPTPSTKKVRVPSSRELTISFPYLLSKYSFFSVPKTQELQTFQGKCLESDGERVVREDREGDIISYIYNCQQGVFSQLPFSPNNFSLWSLDYYLFSGKQPQFSITGQAEYLQEYVSRFREFPEIPGFKNLQKADGFPFNQSAYKEEIGNALHSTPFRTDYSYISPQKITNEKDSLLYAVTQNAQNQGVLGIQKMNVMPLPEHWQMLAVENGNPEIEFVQSKVTATQQILPSMWRVSLQVPQTTDKEKFVGLVFNQAYDQQWQLFRTNSFVTAFFGRNRVNAEHTKVNGWANGWLLPVDDLPTNTTITYYVFFIPERLAFLGWGITLGLPIIIVLWGTWRRRRRLRKVYTDALAN